MAKATLRKLIEDKMAEYDATIKGLDDKSKKLIEAVQARTALCCIDAIKEERTLAGAEDSLTRLAYYFIDKAIPVKTSPVESKEFFFGFVTPDNFMVESNEQ